MFLVNHARHSCATDVFVLDLDHRIIVGRLEPSSPSLFAFIENMACSSTRFLVLFLPTLVLGETFPQHLRAARELAPIATAHMQTADEVV